MVWILNYMKSIGYIYNFLKLFYKCTAIKNIFKYSKLQTSSVNIKAFAHPCKNGALKAVSIEKMLINICEKKDGKL